MITEQTRAKQEKVPVERLRELFLYSPSGGSVVWRRKNNLHFALQPAGHINFHGYIVTHVDKRILYNHRVAWALHYGSWPEGELDHIDRNKLNNRIDNLRIASKSENVRNTGLQSNNTSGVKGVKWHKASKRWVATVKRNGKRRFLGSFATKEHAEIARFWSDILDPSIPIQHTLSKPECH